jgi:cellulose biosynthesis protein BcsQ
MQPKGGAGKSFTALHLIQFLRNNSLQVQAFDLDIANNTLEQFKQLDAIAVDISNSSLPSKIDPLKFDPFLEQIISSSASDIVIDIGASIISEFSIHLNSVDFYNLSKELELHVIIHTPISGGQAFLDSLGGLKTLFDYTQNDAKYVIWANPYFGLLERNGKSLEEMQVIKSMTKSIAGFVYIPNWDSEVVQHDVMRMLSLKLTYEEIAGSDEFNIFSKSRLKRVKDDFFSRIESANL